MNLTPESWQAIQLTFELATLTTLLLLVLATPLAWWLSQTQSAWRAPIHALVTLPLVLPPSVLGFYLLIVMGPQGPLGQFTLSMGWGVLSFTFTGLLIGSILFSLPFAVQPLQHAFDAIGSRPMEVAATLRASPAHTVGEFGVVLMIGGNIPGQTRVVSTEIYGHVEAMEYAQAHLLAAGMLIFSFVVLLALALMNRRQRQVV